MTTIFFLAMAMVCASLYFWKQHAIKRGNHYRRRGQPSVTQRSAEPSSKPTKHEPVIDRDPLIESTRSTLSKAAAIHFDNNTEEKKNARANLPIAFYLMAPENASYVGYELLQALLSVGLRYGRQQIFHRHLHKDGRGAALFHCAQAIAPGAFDLTKMGALSCPGLCLFFNAATVDAPVSVFDALLETIDQLVDDLGGKVFDEKHQLLTREKLFSLKQQVVTLEKNKTTADLFDE